MLLWQACENRVKFFVTYILSNTRILKQDEKQSFYNALASSWKLCLK